jgi:hypothetical protein
MKILISTFLICLFILCLPASANAEGPMRFLAYQQNGQQIIVAEGYITRDTPKHFAAFLKTQKTSPDRILLHSSGGHLISGLQLGYMLRKKNLSTEIGRLKDGMLHTGRCASSCAYAFLGGKERFARAEELGVHVYSFENARTGQTLSLHQVQAQSRIIIDAMLNTYIKKMGVDLKVLKHAFRTPHDKMYYFSMQELKAYNINASESLELEISALRPSL